VADLVTAAGGLLPEADVDRLNLAAKVVDGTRVYIPRKGEAPPAEAPAGDATGGTAPAGSAPTGGAPAGAVDLNTATAAQLDTLPGIGPATANAIITYRTRNGRFKSVTELLEVPGIGPAKLEAIRPLVTVS
jgi:competence protein ComEA